MKIGIYTLPLNYNYGGLLQAYALQTVLERLGHNVIIIDRPLYIKESFWKRPREKVRRFIHKYVKGQKRIRVFQENYEQMVLPSIMQYTQCFISRYLHTLSTTNLSSLRNEDFDAIIVGSDQIWRCGFHDSKKKIYDAYLDFAKDWSICRIAYAASFGVDKWEYDEKKTLKCKALIKKFQAISVREDTGVTLCKEHFGVNAIQVLDPTALLLKEDYIQLIKESYTLPSSGELMIYLLDRDNEKDNIVNRIADTLKLSPFIVNSLADDSFAPIEKRIQPPVETWLRGFYDAKFIITDSFHACVFSIIFEKPFLVIGNQNRGMDRFHSLLKMCNLEDRLVLPKFDSKLPTSSILDAKEKLGNLKSFSLDFLKNNLI